MIALSDDELVIELMIQKDRYLRMGRELYGHVYGWAYVVALEGK
jgi:hypothetical protein